MKTRFQAIIQLMFLLFIITAYGISSAVAGPSPVSTMGDKPKNAEYLFGVGDIIEIQVWNEKDLSRTLRVRLDGRISLPLIGEIEAAGKSPRELSAQIEERYAKTIASPSVTAILNQSNQRYYVLGQVKQPGEFPLDAHLTVLQALARSGGFLEWAKPANIVVIRGAGGKEQVIPFDYEAITKKKDQSQNLPLAPGDTIVVP